MKIAVAMTVCDRPWYLEKVLESWTKVRGVEAVQVQFNVEPTQYTPQNLSLIRQYFPASTYFINGTVAGSQVNPYYAVEDAFSEADYVILAEDDLVVSDDILEYHEWAATHYREDTNVAMVCSFSSFNAAPELSSSVLRVSNFASVWVWGTWWDRWASYLAPNWDMKYEHGEGFEKGWDWHFNTRVLPKLNKYSLQPMVSRVQNIGEEGVHGTAFSLVQSPVFQSHHNLTNYVELGV